jgi:hypothetical protein
MPVNKFAKHLLEAEAQPKFCQIRRAIRSLEHQLEMAASLGDLPEDLRAAVKDLQSKISNYDMEAVKQKTGHKVNQMTGPLIGLSAIRKVVRDVLGGTWESTVNTMQEYAEAVGSEEDDVMSLLPDADEIMMTADPNLCKVATLTRKVMDDDEDGEIRVLDFIMMPGHVYLSLWQTDGSDGDGPVMSNAEFAVKFKDWVESS